MRIKCNKCWKVLECWFPWMFASCDCDNEVFIDETEHYVRIWWTKDQYTVLDRNMKFKKHEQDWHN